jgi:protein-L-isoaspartate(D-aspartate) O-methyltransferase
MDWEQKLAVIRRAYAQQILGPGPWPILPWLHGYVQRPSHRPVYLYTNRPNTNRLIAVMPEHGLNNSEPAFHAKLIRCAAPQPGEHAVHIGAGVGCYTAILAELVTSSGTVTGIELDPELAARARANFAQWPNVRVVHGDGTMVSFEPADVIYVNAGATRPADIWLDGLKEGGRLILPLTTDQGFGRSNPPLPMERCGAVFRIERRSAEYLAQWISPVAIFPCAGARDAASEAALAEAFRKGGWQHVTRLYRRNDIPEEYCWLRAPDWCLTYDLPEACRAHAAVSDFVATNDAPATMATVTTLRF